MNRNYSDGVKKDVDFFLGEEVEHTPAYGKYTLFVVGLHDPSVILEITSRYKGVEHIYFGANQSFPRLACNDAEGWEKWEKMIRACLDEGYWCTLDLDVSCVDGLAEGGLTENRRFIPMISVKIPYVQLLNFNYNATVKIDDKDFNASNPGVWCHSLHDLMDREKFTNWDAYRSDKVIQ